MDYLEHVKSMLDTDLYKLTMAQAVLELFPDTIVEYRFKNRGKQRFNIQFLDALNKEINDFSSLALTDTEFVYLKKNCPYLKPMFLEYMRNFRYNPSEVQISLDKNNDLMLSIKGPWCSTIFWEVPLMATISGLYFTLIDTEWDMENQLFNLAEKAVILGIDKAIYADFGTRRRRSFETQNLAIKTFKDSESEFENIFVGTSNIYLAMKHKVKCVGTMAHEYIQAMSVLESLNHPNYFALQNWVRVYNTSLGIALTDTYTTDAFLKNFNNRFAKLYDGVRHDSGDPIDFMKKIVAHYKSLGIDPMSKTIVFSDGLNPDAAIKVNAACKNKIKCSFGIGTNFTNSFENSPALNMVIKLWSVNGFPVVKLSDTEGKENGDPKAIENMKWIVKQSLKSNGTK